MKALFVLALLVFFFGSCDLKVKSTNFKEATIKWTGPVAADGCGFYVLMDGKEYKPVDESAIGEEFKQLEEVKVLINYEKTGETIEFSCGMQPTVQTIRTIDIKEIRLPKP